VAGLGWTGLDWLGWLGWQGRLVILGFARGNLVLGMQQPVVQMGILGFRRGI